MNDIKNHGVRKTELYGRYSKPFLNEFLKDLHQLKPFETELAGIGIDKDKITGVKILHNSFLSPNFHSIYLGLPDGQKYISIRNDKKNMLKIFPEKDSEFLFCEGTEKSKSDKVGMFIDRYKKEILPGEKKPFYYYSIVGALHDKKSIDLKKLTEDYRTNMFVSSTMRQVAQIADARKVDFEEFKKIYDTDSKFTAFLL